MFTICPKCALTLLVTAEDLRIAQGYVRCGRCSSVFNALARLTEERQAPEPPEEPPDTTPASPESSRAASPAKAPPPPPPSAAPSDDAPISEDALEFDPSRTDVSKVFVEPPPNPQWSAATGSFKAMMAANQEAMQLSEDASLQDTSPRSPPDRPPTQASGTTDDDEDIDVEIGPEQLADILRSDLAPVPPAAPSPAAAAAAPPAPKREPPAAAPAPPAPPQPPPPAQRQRPNAPAASARPPRGNSAEQAAAEDSQPPASSRKDSQAPALARPESSAPRPPPAAPPPPSSEPAQAAAAGSAAETEPPNRYARVLRVVRPSAGSQFASHLWSAGAVVMLLALIAQVVNHYRDALAADARFNRPLTAIYAALGVPLEPHWDVKAYDVRQLGASVEPGATGLITVRASVKNGAAQPQPLPLLRVTLQDRFGNRIAARDVAPRFYLPHNAPPLLSAGGRIDAEMGFVDPGANAVGFEIDACLPTRDGAVTCANDSSAR
ncbi:MAG TPA: zinc-ribbon and DUF3426 domain-containing protein [Steroidobacteraceae bacterium]|nr:zinc-ribbon and DUF3426 domain-containing protein [Steroidobacteraceae bacterium]